MAREKKVIDASIVVKWFIADERSKEALDLRFDHLAGHIAPVVSELLFTVIYRIFVFHSYALSSF